MTHRQLMELAAWLAEHGADLAARCRGIPVPALRRYLKTRKTQCQDWSNLLQSCGRSEPDERPPHAAAQPAARLGATIEEIAVNGIVVRVAGSLFYAIGERLDIPLARDVARQSVRCFENVIELAMATIAIRADISPSELNRLDKLGALCDRLSDLLCGALWPQLKCDRFAVDRERVADFAGTFGARPSMVRVPIRRACSVLARRSVWRLDLAAEIEQSLLNCFPTLVNWRSAPSDELTDLREMFTPRILRMPAAIAPTAAAESPGSGISLAFPTCSFARMLRKVLEMRRAK